MVVFGRLLCLLVAVSVGLRAVDCGENKSDAIAVVSNHRQAVWSQLLLRDLRAQEHGLQVVCLLQGDLRKIDRSAFEQLCDDIFPAAPLTGYGVAWQKVRIFIEDEFRHKYRNVAFVANNAAIVNKVQFYDAIGSFNGTLGMHAQVCGMSTKGRYREFKRQFWGMLLPIYEPSEADDRNICYQNKMFIVNLNKVGRMGLSRASVNAMMIKYPEQVFTRREWGFIQLLFWNNMTSVDVDTTFKYRNCVLDDNEQCSW